MPSIIANGNSWTSRFGVGAAPWAMTIGRLITSIIDTSLRRRGTQRARVPVEELSLKILEDSELNSVSNPAHGVKVKVEIMDRIENAARHLPHHEQVPQ